MIYEMNFCISLLFVDFATANAFSQITNDLNLSAPSKNAFLLDPSIDNPISLISDVESEKSLKDAELADCALKKSDSSANIEIARRKICPSTNPSTEMSPIPPSGQRTPGDSYNRCDDSIFDLYVTCGGPEVETLSYPYVGWVMNCLLGKYRFYRFDQL